MESESTVRVVLAGLCRAPRPYRGPRARRGWGQSAVGIRVQRESRRCVLRRLRRHHHATRAGRANLPKRRESAPPPLTTSITPHHREMSFVR